MGTWGVETGEAIGAHVTDSLAHIAVNDRTYLKRGGGQGLVVLWRLHAVHALTHKCTDLLRVLITLPQRSLSKDNLLLFFFYFYSYSHFFPTSHLLWMEAHTASWPRELRNSQQGCYSKDFPRSDFTVFGPKLLQNLQSKERYNAVYRTNHWVRVSFSMLQGT